MCLISNLAPPTQTHNRHCDEDWIVAKQRMNTSLHAGLLRRACGLRFNTGRLLCIVYVHLRVSESVVRFGGVCEATDGLQNVLGGYVKHQRTLAGLLPDRAS